MINITVTLISFYIFVGVYLQFGVYLQRRHIFDGGTGIDVVDRIGFFMAGTESVRQATADSA